MIDQYKKAQLHRILDDIIVLQNMGYDAFFDFAGHVNRLDIQVYDGWEAGKESILETTLHTDLNDSNIQLEVAAEYIEKMIDQKMEKALSDEEA